MGNDDHSHISAFLMGFRRVRGLILKRFDISSKVLTSAHKKKTHPHPQQMGCPTRSGQVTGQDQAQGQGVGLRRAAARRGS